MEAAAASSRTEDITGTDEEQKAALKIQSQRGKQARAKVAELKAKQLAAAEAEVAATAGELPRLSLPGQTRSRRRR